MRPLRSTDSWPVCESDSSGLIINRRSEGNAVGIDAEGEQAAEAGFLPATGG